MKQTPIKLMVVDDHPAFRIGLTAGSRRSLSIAGGIIITLAGFAMMTAALATAS